MKLATVTRVWLILVVCMILVSVLIPSHAASAGLASGRVRHRITIWNQRRRPTSSHLKHRSRSAVVQSPYLTALLSYNYHYWYRYGKKGNGSPYSRVPELITVLGSQPAGDESHNPAVGCHYFPPGPQLPSQLLRGLLACYQFRCLMNRGTISVNSLPKTVTRQRRGCDLNPGLSAPESSTLTTRLPSHPLLV